MDAVQVERLLDGRYFVGTYTDTLSEAMGVVGSLLNRPPSEAYKATVAQVNAPTLTTEQEARLAATDPPDPIDVLNVDKPRSYEDGRE